MDSSFTFLRVRGIPIGANWSWIIVFGLIAWSLGTGLYPAAYPGLDPSTYLMMGAVTAVAFALSIVLHELGHALRALKEGMKIEGITLWFFGGVAKFRGMFPSAGAEFRIAIAGPLVSLGLAVGFGLISLISLSAPITGVVGYVAFINLVLVGFNIVPALPLDGGRVLRAFLWSRRGNFTSATVSAAKAGRAFGASLIGIGLVTLFSGAGLNGVWFAFLGYFLVQASAAEVSSAMLRGALSGIRVKDLMTPDPVTVSPNASSGEFLEQARLFGHSYFPVVDSSLLVGIVSAKQAAEAKANSIVRDFMTEDVQTVAPEDELFDAVVKLDGHSRTPVLQNGHLVGILSASDVRRAIRPVAPSPSPRRESGFVWVIVGAIIVAAIAYLYHPPLVVISPGAAIDVSKDIEITGAQSDVINGRYLLTSVSVRQTSALGVAISFFRPQHRIVALSDLIPPGMDEEEFFDEQERLFAESRMAAAAAAAKQAGLRVSLSGRGARVEAVPPNSPAADILTAGDVITAVDSRPIFTDSDLTSIIRTRPPGTSFRLTVDREDESTMVTARSATLSDQGPGIGVFVSTRDLKVDLPFDIKFRSREIGGPSAGLAYALAISDLLDNGDYAQSRTVAATGTIDLDGIVGDVGGLAQKASGAERRGADLFLVPSSEVSAARSTDLPVRGVASLAAAIMELQAA